MPFMWHLALPSQNSPGDTVLFASPPTQATPPGGSLQGSHWSRLSPLPLVPATTPTSPHLKGSPILSQTVLPSVGEGPCFSGSLGYHRRLSSLSLPDGPFSPKDGQAEHTLSENDEDFQRPHKRSDTGVWEHRQRTAVQILAWDFRACWSEDWGRSHLPWPKGALRKEKRLGPRLSGYRTDVPRRIQKP